MLDYQYLTIKIWRRPKFALFLQIENITCTTNGINFKLNITK